MNTSTHTGLASGLRVVHRLLIDRGQDADAWFADQGMDPQLLWDPRARVDGDLGERLLLQLVIEYPDENLGVALASYSRFMDHHLLSVLTFASANGVEAFRRLNRYQVFMNTAEPFLITEDDEFLTVERRILMELPAAALAQAYFFAMILNDLKQIGITAPFKPIVSFTTEPQGSIESYHQVFGRKIRFEQPKAFLSIPREILVTPLTTANPDIISMNEDMFGALVRSVKATGLQPGLRMKILDSLPDRVISEDDAAQMLNMSVRTLQRRLKGEGTSFKAVQQEARTQLATTMLSDPALSVTEIAFNCGFSEQASFSRAFRRWTDRSPSEFRADVSA